MNLFSQIHLNNANLLKVDPALLLPLFLWKTIISLALISFILIYFSMKEKIKSSPNLSALK